MKFGLVVGTRPNFVKAAALVEAFSRRGHAPILIHTGQHFDAALSDVFFRQLQLPAPDHYLGVQGSSRGEQLGAIVSRLSALLPTLKIDELFVVGDVTSTAAGALAGDACDIFVNHVEAGLRSFDWSMPEERNRRVVDAIAQRLFVSEPAGTTNLLREGCPPERVHYVGNVMIDTLLKFKGVAESASVWSRFGFSRGAYAVATLHRPSNVDDANALGECLAVLARVAQRYPVLFSAHPRTRARLDAFGLSLPVGVRLCEPLEYLDFIGLVLGAAVVLTDSGGAQEETTALGVPCLTMRGNTERPVTVEEGTSRLVGRDMARVNAALFDLENGHFRRTATIHGWDGRAADRIVDIVLKET